jgi:hypothetical protein
MEDRLKTPSTIASLNDRKGWVFKQKMVIGDILMLCVSAVWLATAVRKIG